MAVSSAAPSTMAGGARSRNNGGGRRSSRRGNRGRRNGRSESPSSSSADERSTDDSTASSSSDHSLKAMSPPSSSPPSFTTTNSHFNRNSFKKPSLPCHSQYIGLDCEMVGGISGESLCARVVLVDWKGKVLFDSHVKPNQVIADYRTAISGICEQDLVKAPSLEVVRRNVLRITKGKIIVGHGLENDFKCLNMKHPWHDTRDTATYEPFLQTDPTTGAKTLPRKLKDLVKERFGKSIQGAGPHSPAEDAFSALRLYKCHRPRWEILNAHKLKQERDQHKRRQQQIHAEKLYQSEQQHRLQMAALWQQQQQQLYQQQHAAAAATYAAPPGRAMAPPAAAVSIAPPGRMVYDRTRVAPPPRAHPVFAR